MKSFREAVIVLAAAFFASAYQAKAVTYSDSTGDTFTTAGGGILDITSVEVNNDATDLIFKINLAGNPVTTDWGKYMIGISTGGSPSDSVGNGWNRPIGMPNMDYWVGSWVDSGNGAELYKYTGSWPFPPQNATWGSNPANVRVVTKDSSSVTLAFQYGWLGLGVGNTFNFDVYTSGGGGGDGAIDALGNPNQTISDWGNYYNSGSNVKSYTIVPEPSTLALAGLGGLMLVGRLFRRRA